MRIAVLAPLFSQAPESSLVYMLARYLSDAYKEIVQLQCNGLFSTCDRDHGNGWRRTMTACLDCGLEQLEYARWAEVQSKELSQCLTPEEVEQSRRWVASLPTAQLVKARFRGATIFDLCAGSLERQLGVAVPDVQNKRHEQAARRMMLAALRMSMASRRFLTQFRPEISLVADGTDFITRSYLSQCAEQGRDAALLRWDMSGRCIRVINPRTGHIGSSEIVVEEVCAMRSDYKTWPPEFLAGIENLLSFLGISAAQLQLPIAR